MVAAAERPGLGRPMNINHDKPQPLFQQHMPASSHGETARVEEKASRVLGQGRPCFPCRDRLLSRADARCVAVKPAGRRQLVAVVPSSRLRAAAVDATLSLLPFGAVFARNNVAAVTGANGGTRSSPCKVPWRLGYNVLLFPHRRAVCEVWESDPTESPKVLKRIPFQAGRTAVDKLGIAHGRPSSGFLRRCRATLPSALCPCAAANDLFPDLGVCLLFSSSVCKKGASYFAALKGPR